MPGLHEGCGSAVNLINSVDMKCPTATQLFTRLGSSTCRPHHLQEKTVSTHKTGRNSRQNRYFGSLDSCSTVCLGFSLPGVLETEDLIRNCSSAFSPSPIYRLNKSLSTSLIHFYKKKQVCAQEDVNTHLSVIGPRSTIPTRPHSWFHGFTHTEH